MHRRLEGLDLPRITPRIHQMCLSGLYKYEDFKAAYPQLQIYGDYSKEAEGRHYRTKAIISENQSFVFRVYLNPDIPGPTLCWVEVPPVEDVSIGDHKAFLESIDEKLPRLSPSKVEYATDQFCIEPGDVERLFFIEKRHLYVPYQRVSFQWGENSFVLDAKDRLNYTYYPAPSAADKDADEYVTYERGMDGDKNKEGGWERAVLDRVRLEHRVRRKTLRKHGINTLSDFIGGPKFYELNHGRYYFRHFSGSRILPERGDAYLAKDPNGNVGMYMVEHQFFRNRMTNIWNYPQDTPEFQTLIEAFDREWRRFDDRWKGAPDRPT